MAHVVSAALLAAACSTVYGIEGVGELPAGADELLRMYPGARVQQDQGRVHIIYGVPMTPGLTAHDAATSFIQLHGAAFGAGNLQLAEDWSADFGDGSSTVFCYQQHIAGIPVEYGVLKVLVHNGPVPQVTYAAGILAAVPEGFTGTPALSAKDASGILRSMEAWKNVPTWSAPQLVIYQGTGDWVKPVLAWKISGDDPNPAATFHRTFFLDANTGALMKIRDDVNYTDVTGTIQGKGSPGLLPDEATNPPALLNVPVMRASIAGGNNAYTDTSGNFTIPNSGTTPVNVSCGVNGTGAGQWVNVVPTGASPITAILNNVTPPGPANLVLNPTPAEQLTAQVNAFICVTLTHDYFKGHAPTFTRLDLAIPANTGVSGTCNAFYQNNTVNFYNSGGGCPNTAYTTVISHEYGHFIVAHLGPTGAGLAQNAFGEGYGDTNAAMIWDDGVTGRDFFGPGTHVRDPIADDIQYPCSQEIHTCGEVLSGVWWRTRTAMGAFYGSQQGLDLTRNLEVKWSLITTGGPDNSNAAGPSTAIEVLTADDNDGNINNGTPNYSRICSSFSAHNIQCPPLQLLNFAYPAGRPDAIPGGQPFPIPVNVSSNAADPMPNTGTLSYRVDGTGSYTTIPMVQGATPNQYTATIPATPCGHVVNYYVGALTTSNIGVTDPMNAPTSVYGTITGHLANTDLFNVNFNSMPAGWTNDGLWHISSSCAPSGTACAGSPWAYYGQDATCNYNTGVSNHGSITAPAVALPPATPNGTVSLTYCYALVTEASAGHDKAQVLVNGTQVDIAPESAAWTTRSIDLTSYAGQTVTIAFKFDTVDAVFNNFRGWALGSARLRATAVACDTCYANCDGSTTPPVLTVNDFVCFQSAFAAGQSYANCDGSTTPPVLTVNDFVCFQSAFAAGCP
jgi:hypothetical protein